MKLYFKIFLLFYFSSYSFAQFWNSVTPTGTQLSPRYLHTSALTKNGSVFIFGGIDSSSNSLNDIGIFNLQTNEWDLLNGEGEIPLPRFGSSSVLTPNNTILIFFGSNGTVDYNDVTEYNFNSNSWVSLTVNGIIPSPRFSSSYIVYENYVIFFGGSTTENSLQVLNSTLKFNLNSISWEELSVTGAIPSSRSGSVPILYSDLMILFGGLGENSYFNDLNSFNLETNVWNQITPSGNPPCPRTGMSGVISPNNMFIVFGGKNETTYFNDVNTYDIVNNSWLNLLPLPNSPPSLAERTSNLIQLSSSLTIVILFGGFNGTTALNRIDEYEISSTNSQSNNSNSLLVIILCVVVGTLFVLGLVGVFVSLFCCRTIKVPKKKAEKTEIEVEKKVEESPNSP